MLAFQDKSNPSESSSKLSLQIHHHSSERWVVVEVVIRGGDELVFNGS